MSDTGETSNVVAFGSGGGGAPPSDAMLAQTINRLVEVNETILRLEAVVGSGPTSDPVTLAARRSVARMKEDAVRIALILQATLPPAPEPIPTPAEPDNIQVHAL